VSRTSLSAPSASEALGKVPSCTAQVNMAAASKGWLAATASRKPPVACTCMMAALSAELSALLGATHSGASRAARGEMVPALNVLSTERTSSGSPDTRPAVTAPEATAASSSSASSMYTTSHRPPSSTLGGSTWRTEW